MAFLLSNWLITNFPSDIMMPVARNTKSPMFRHRNNEWSWEMYDKFVEDNKYEVYDVCVVLQNLCVIDVDSKQQADHLEARFPCLKNTACEETARGRHYWFVRSPIADKLGYYDGAAQRIKGIDFKTVCKNGTGGIILVAPSINKTWVREPWNTHVDIIPFALLDAIAVPSNQYIDVKLEFFPDLDLNSKLDEIQHRSTLHLQNCPWLHNISFFEPFINDDEISTINGYIPVPCRKESFQDLIHIIENGNISCNHPTKEWLDEVTSTADKLGVSKKIMDKLHFGLPRAMLDLYQMCPTMWQAHISEREIVDIDENISKILVFKGSICDDERLIFPLLRHQQPRIPIGIRMLHPYPAIRVARNIHSIVLQILCKHPGRIVLAGGSVLGIVANHVKAGTDSDLFIVTEDKAVADIILKDFMELVNNYTFSHRLSKTNTAITVCFNDMEQTVLQVILRLFPTRTDVLASFDVAPCKIMAFCDDNGTDLHVSCLPAFIVSMQHMTFHIDMTKWSPSSIYRLLKYRYKGFSIILPGLRRQAIKHDVLLSTDVYPGKTDLANLFRLEISFIKSQRFCKSFTNLDFRFLISKLRVQESNYDTMEHVMNHGYLWNVIQWINSYFKCEKKTTTWVYAKDLGAFPASAPMMARAYDTSILTSLLYAS